MRPKRLVLGLFAAATLTACGASPDASGTDETAVTATAATAPTMIPATEATMTTDPPGSIPITTNEPQAAAIADLAARLGVDQSTIAVTRHEEVEWSDGSLGCPKPGFNYTQAITPGYLIVLTVSGRDYEYHGRPGGGPIYCEAPSPPSAGVVGGP